MGLLISVGSESFDISTTKLQRAKAVLGISTELQLLNLLKQLLINEVKKAEQTAMQMNGSDYDVT